MSPEYYRGGGGYDDYQDPAKDRAFRFKQEEAERNEKANIEDEKREGLADKRFLYFSSLARESIGDRVKRKEASRPLREMEQELAEFTEYARRNGYIKSSEDFERLSLSDRIKLAVYFFVIKPADEAEEEEEQRRRELGYGSPFVLGKRSRNWPGKPKPSIALFVPTAKRREEIVAILPKPVQDAADFTLFSDSNDFDRQ